MASLSLDRLHVVMAASEAVLRLTISLDTQLGHTAPFRMEVSVAKSKAERDRFFSCEKVEAVLRVLRGEALDLVYRETGFTASTLSE